MKKKITAVLLSAVMVVLCFANAVNAGQINESEWTTGGGWGSITANGDGTFTFKGDEVLNEDNSHKGPYTKANATRLEDGDIIEKTDIYINPSMWKAGEKFTLTVSINDTLGSYKTELLALFYRDNDGSVAVSVGLDPSFSAKIEKAGIYTLTHRYFVKEDQVYSQFSIHNDDELVGQTSEIDMKAQLSEVTTRGYIWFSDISLENGLVVGRPGYPSEEPPKQEAPQLSPSDWVTSDGEHGSVEIKNDNQVILKGSESESDDGTHSGPYISANGGSFEDGAVNDEIHIYIDPQNMTTGEKFAITSSVESTQDETLSEIEASFSAQTDGEVTVKVSADESFDLKITQPGLYTIKYSFIPGDTIIFGSFSVSSNNEVLAQTENIPLYDAPRELARGRGALWFNDISVNEGIAVYSVKDADYTAVDAALEKVPQDLSKYTDESVEKLNDAIAAVERDLDAAQQEKVDAMAKAIEDAIDALEEKKEETTQPEDTTKPDETEPGDTTKPEDTTGDNEEESTDEIGSSDNSQENDSEQDEEQSGDENENIPSSGDERKLSPVIAAVVLIVGAASTTLFIRRKRINE